MNQGYYVVIERSGPMSTQLQCFVEDDQGQRICSLPLTGYALSQDASGNGSGSIELTPGRLQIRD